MHREDTLPWYRQFWPWFLIALPATAVIAGFYTLYIAVQSQDSLVINVEKSIGDTTEQILIAERRAIDLGLEARIDINRESGLIVAKLSADAALEPPMSLVLELFHPAFRDRDISVQMARSLPDADGNATWSGHFVDVPDGRWYAVIRSEDWRLNGSWAGEATLTLRPASQNGG